MTCPGDNPKPQVLYRMFDADDGLLYVGISMNVAQRFAAHRSDKQWWGDITRIALEHFATRQEVLAAEHHAIRSEHPRYNVQHTPRTLVAVAGTVAETAERIDAMDETHRELYAASQHRRALEIELEESRSEEREAIVAALDAGMKQAQVCEITGFTREHVRRIAIAIREERATGT